MSLVYQLEQASKIQDKLKDNKDKAETNWKIANFNAQYSPTDKNKKAEKDAKGVYKDLGNAVKDVKGIKKDIKRGVRNEDESKKLAKRFQRFLKAGDLERAETLMGHINSSDALNIDPYLSKNFGRLAGKNLGINFNSNLDLAGEQLLAQSSLTDPKKNYFDALSNPIQFLDDVKGLVDKINTNTRQKEQIIDDMLRPNKQQEQSNLDAFQIAGNVELRDDDESKWPSIKDAKDPLSVPVKYDEQMDLFAPQIIPLETAQGSFYNFTFG